MSLQAGTVTLMLQDITAQQGDRRKRSSDQARTRDLCSSAEFQPSSQGTSHNLSSLMCPSMGVLQTVTGEDLHLEAGTYVV